MLDLSKHRLVRETPEAWHVHDGEREFAVAKHGLDPETHQQIAQHFADGGAVKPTDDGQADLVEKPSALHRVFNAGGNDDAAQARVEADIAKSNAETAAQAKAGAGAVADTGQGYLGAIGDAAQTVADNVPAPVKQALGGAATSAVGLPSIIGESMVQNANAPTEGTSTSTAEENEKVRAKDAETARINKELGVTSAPGAQQQAPQQPAGPLAAGTNTGAFDKAAADEQKQTEEIGKQQAAGAAHTATILGNAAQAHQKNMDDAKSTFLNSQANAKALTDAVLSNQIDPNGFWNSRSVPQKISAAIGMVLGGLGSGLTGGPNYAAQVINNAIDRDVAAQKMNQDNMHAGIAHYVQMGHDALAASQLWSADLKDVTAAQVEQQAAATQSLTAIPQAKALADKLRMEAQTQRLNIAFQQIRNGSDAINLETQRQLTPIQRQNMMLEAKGTQRVYGAQGNDPTAPPTALDLKKNIPGVQLVNGPHGEPQAALGEDSAKAVKESQTALAPIADALGQMRRLLGPEGSPVIGDRARAKALQNEMALAINAATTNRAITSEEKDFITSRIPDLTSVVKPYAKQQLDELDRWMASKGAAVNKANLYGAQ